jgi:hypothetical protein
MPVSRQWSWWLRPTQAILDGIHCKRRNPGPVDHRERAFGDLQVRDSHRLEA